MDTPGRAFNVPGASPVQEESPSSKRNREADMHRHGSTLFVALFGVALAGLAACADEVPTPSEAAFAALQARGEEAMGVDQYTSTHRFDVLPDGGRIELQRDIDDPAGVARIRQHLQEITRAFESGDFSTPAFVHARHVPGASALADRRDAITYTFRELPRGGEIRIVTENPDALAAIHEFMAFQREDHRAGGVEHRSHARGEEHGSHAHGERHGDHARGSHHGAASHESGHAQRGGIMHGDAGTMEGHRHRPRE
jgi:hypothetical protein